MDAFQQLAQQSLPLLLVIGAILAFVESALGVGLFFPGEATITVLAIATTGPERVWLLGASVAIGAVSGDHAGYLMGRRYGDRLRTSRLIGRLGVGRWDQATEQLRRHGMLAVLVSRLLPVVRTVMPAVAGVAGLTYVRFLAASMLGSVVWSGLWVGLGSGARVLVGSDLWLPTLVVLAGVIPVLVVRSCRLRSLEAKAARPAAVVARRDHLQRVPALDDVAISGLQASGGPARVTSPRVCPGPHRTAARRAAPAR